MGNDAVAAPWASGSSTTDNRLSLTQTVAMKGFPSKQIMTADLQGTSFKAAGYEIP